MNLRRSKTKRQNPHNKTILRHILHLTLLKWCGLQPKSIALATRRRV
jgi:hypothetical protein